MSQPGYTQSPQPVAPEAAPAMTTVRFEMPHRLMAVRLASLYGRPWLYGAAALIVAAGVAAVFDLRWLIVGLMILFIATPLMLSLLYLNYGLRPACVANILPHTVELLPDAIRVSVWPRAEKSDLPAEPENSDATDSSPTPDLPAVSHVFPLDSLCPYTVGLDSVTIPIAGKGFIWLPSSAFPDHDGLTAFMQALSRHGRKLEG